MSSWGSSVEESGEELHLFAERPRRGSTQSQVMSGVWTCSSLSEGVSTEQLGEGESICTDGKRVMGENQEDEGVMTDRTGGGAEEDMDESGSLVLGEDVICSSQGQLGCWMV